MYLIYSLLYILVLPFILPVHLLKRPPGLRRRWLRERFGYLRLGTEGKKRPVVWIHAVSVGEAMAARPLVERLRERADIAVSTVTDTGQRVVRDFITEGEVCFYMPFDIPSSLRRAMELLRPAAVLIMETELWPNLLRTAGRMGVPVAVVNGRMSERSFRGYRKIRFFIRSVLGLIDCYCVQSEGDAEKLKSLGAPEDRIFVTGNLKFDRRPPEGRPDWCRRLGRPVVVAGSTHEGEEEVILEAFRALKRVFRDATLIIAPRHPERFTAVEGLLRDRAVDFTRRSIGGEGGVILLDTIGELPDVYGSADVCLIGGSFVPRGGHNLFEPASWGKPIVCGPHMENFPLADEFFKRGAAVRAGADELGTILLEILSDGEKAEEMGRKARELYSEKGGAVLRTLEVLEGLLPSNPASGRG